MDVLAGNVAAPLRRAYLRRRPTPAWFGVTATVDNHRPIHSRSAACVIGMGSRVLSREAPSAPGQLLHLSILPAHRRFGLTRNRSVSRPAGRVLPEGPATGSKVLLVLDHGKPYYLDGAPAGHATTLSAEIQPAALTLLVPADR